MYEMSLLQMRNAKRSIKKPGRFVFPSGWLHDPETVHGIGNAQGKRGLSAALYAFSFGKLPHGIHLPQLLQNCGGVLIQRRSSRLADGCFFG